MADSPAATRTRPAVHDRLARNEALRPRWVVIRHHGLAVGFGRIVVSETEAPNMLANLA